MKRRQLIGYAGAGLATALLTNLGSNFPAAAESSGLSVQYLGHTCFLFGGDGVQILVNPFKSIGCTAGYRIPKVSADLVLISSQLLDEGGIVDGFPKNPKLVYEAGEYKFQGIKLQGFAIDHDRKGGRQFGKNIAWRWTQGGINIVHLGGAAAPITKEQKILMGGSDLLFIPVGGSDKAYNAQEAKEAIGELNPKIVIPTQYQTQAADTTNCNISPIDDFLTAMKPITAQKSNNDSMIIHAEDLPTSMEIRLLSYNFSGQDAKVRSQKQ